MPLDPRKILLRYRAARDSGVITAEGTILLALHTGAPKTISRLARETAFSRKTVLRTVTDMEESQLVARRDDGYAITALGWEVMRHRLRCMEIRFRAIG